MEQDLRTVWEGSQKRQPLESSSALNDCVGSSKNANWILTADAAQSLLQRVRSLFFQNLAGRRVPRVGTWSISVWLLPAAGPGYELTPYLPRYLARWHLLWWSGNAWPPVCEARAGLTWPGSPTSLSPSPSLPRRMFPCSSWRDPRQRSGYGGSDSWQGNITAVPSRRSAASKRIGSTSGAPEGWFQVDNHPVCADEGNWSASKKAPGTANFQFSEPLAPNLSVSTWRT